MEVPIPHGFDAAFGKLLWLLVSIWQQYGDMLLIYLLHQLCRRRLRERRCDNPATVTRTQERHSSAAEDQVLRGETQVQGSVQTVRR